MFRSFAIRNYRLYAAGEFISLIGIWMQFVAQDWLVLQLSGNSGTALGTVTALQFLPITIFALYGGKLADRYDKRTMLIALNTIWGVLATLLAALVISGGIQLWHVFVFAGLFGSVNAIEMPVRQSFVSELVPNDLLPNALSLSSATFNSARIAGPALAGVGIAWFDVGPVFAANAVSYAAPLIGMLLMRPAELHRTATTARQARVLDGLRYVSRRSDLILPMALIGVIAMLGYNFQLTLAVMAKAVFHRGPASFGLLTSTLALGALCGALAGTRRRGRPTVYVVLGAALAFGVLETILGFAPTYLTMAVLLFPTGFAMVFFAQACNQRVQLGASADYRGRVMALYTLVFAGTTPIGAPVIGWLAEHVSARSSLYVGGLVSIVVALIALMIQLRQENVRFEFAAIPAAIDVGAAKLPVGAARILGLAGERDRVPRHSRRRRLRAPDGIKRWGRFIGPARRRPNRGVRTQRPRHAARHVR